MNHIFTKYLIAHPKKPVLNTSYFKSLKQDIVPQLDLDVHYSKAWKSNTPNCILFQSTRAWYSNTNDWLSMPTRTSCVQLSTDSYMPLWLVLRKIPSNQAKSNQDQTHTKQKRCQNLLIFFSSQAYSIKFVTWYSWITIYLLWYVK
jgi:hypothetical protein